MLTQVTPSYAHGFHHDSHLRVQQADANGVGEEIAGALGTPLLIANRPENNTEHAAIMRNISAEEAQAHKA